MILTVFFAKVKELLKKKSSIVIAVSEGIKLADGRYVCELGSVEIMWTHLDISSSGTATYLATSWQQSVAVRRVQ